MAGITITFGDCAENHKGMEIIGRRAAEGLTLAELQTAKERFEAVGRKCQLINLREAAELPVDAEDAYLLLIEQGVGALVTDEKLLELVQEQSHLDVDKKAFMYGRVVNKIARHNLCFDEQNREPNYAEGKGRIVAYADVPLTSMIRDKLPEYFGSKTQALKAEGNYYYDVRKTGISFHGDGERLIVVALRLGAQFPLHYQWFLRSKPIGRGIEIHMASGDLYAMSSKAVGTDWRCSSFPTLRHAAGCEKYTSL